MARRGDPMRTSPGATMFPDLGRARPRQREAGGLKGGQGSSLRAGFAEGRTSSFLA
jgi:hypothetical protein